MILRLFQREKIVVRPTGIEIRQGAENKRGVFAIRVFRPGEIIEDAPIILLDAGERELLQSTSLFNHYFLISKPEDCVALGLGYSSLYGHAAKANAVYDIKFKNTVIRIRAVKKIQPGEEITLNYNGRPDDDTPVYFRPGNQQ